VVVGAWINSLMRRVVAKKRWGARVFIDLAKVKGISKLMR